MEWLFPELAESEDKNVRKELIDAIQGLWDNDALPMPLSVKRKDAWLAWLENQGETYGSIKWHSVLEEPEEMRELLCEWDSNDSIWHDIVFYHSNDKNNCRGSSTC